MANAKELKALITLSGKLDPSLQQTLLMAANKTKKLGGEMGLVQLASRAAMSKMKTGITTAVPALGMLGSKIAAAKTGMIAFATQNKIVNAGLVTMKRVGLVSFSALKIGLKGLAIGFAAVGVAGLAGLLAVGKVGLSAASDLEEVQNVVNVTFEDGAGTIDRWSKSLLDAYGLGELSAKKYTSTMGSMLKSSGITSDDMMTMSQNVTMLTGDMASFHNLKPDEMFEKLRSGISGETEPLKQLGINMSAANLEAYALSQGIEASYSSMSEADKTMLRYNYIMNATKDAQGDFAKTSETSLSNQNKLIKENFTQMSAKIMQGVVPALAQGAQMVNKLISGMDTSVIGGFMTQMVDLGVALLPIAAQILPIMQSVISAIIPPLVQVAQTILPPVISLISRLAATLMPMVAQLFPPIQALISAIIPPLMTLINLILPPITTFLGFLVKVASSGISKIAEVVGKIAGFFGGGGDKGSAAPAKFARGGFARRPSIFGEAGLEAAIPIKPRNPRSVMLLQKTAKLLGVGNVIPPTKHNHPTGKRGAPLQKSVDLFNLSNVIAPAKQEQPTRKRDTLLQKSVDIFNFGDVMAPSGRGQPLTLHYNPIITGIPVEQLGPMLKQQVQDIAAILDERTNMQRRLSFGTT